MTAVRWDRRSPLAVGGTLMVTDERQARIARMLRELRAPKDRTIVPRVEVHEVRLPRRRKR